MVSEIIVHECPSCGKRVLKGDNFCGQCGVKLDETKEPLPKRIQFGDYKRFDKKPKEKEIMAIIDQLLEQGNNYMKENDLKGKFEFTPVVKGPNQPLGNKQTFWTVGVRFDEVKE